MDKYYKRKPTFEESSSQSRQEVSNVRPRIQVNLDELEADPAKRKKISEYHVNDRDIVRRRYLQMGPCQPQNFEFPKTQISGVNRRFIPRWFDEYKNWLEYSVSKDAAYCLCCYLYKENSTGMQGGGETFVTEGFNNWKKASACFLEHVGKHNSVHSKSVQACRDLMTQEQHIEVCIAKQSEQMKKDYHDRLIASVDCVRWLLRQGLPLRGHDESSGSSNRGNFLELLKFLASHCEEISKVVLQNAPENHQLTSPSIQKDIVNAIAFETMDLIIKNLGDELFGILVDESRDISVKEQMIVFMESLSMDTIETGTGLNQEETLKRPGDTRWGSHYGALLNIISLFTPVIGVLGEVGRDAGDSKQRAEALVALKFVQSFEFVFFLYFMRNVLGITNELSQALQKKDQNIVNAMRLVDISKLRLQRMRDGGWDDLLEEISLFCNQHDIPIPNMDEEYVAPGRSRRNIEERKNIYRYRVERFYLVLDQQLKELNDRFNDKNTELLLCVSCFDPKNSFERFNKKKLIRLAKFYPNDFSEIELQVLDNQLETYILDVSSDHDFSELVGIDKLAQKMVETGRHLDYTLVYLLLKLVLILPVATASVERAFSAMKIIKTSLRNRMSDDLLNDSLIPYVEKDIFDSVSNAMILRRFQNMRERRGLLPRRL